MTYQETLDFLFNALPAYHRVGAAAYKANLDNTEAMMSYLNHPERAFKSIHVAGTNGKGSVSHFLASILHRAGLKVGLYTSPHLVDFRERIRINGEMIPQQAVIDFVTKTFHGNAHVPVGNQSTTQTFKHSNTQALNNLSFFEMTVGLAFDFFRNEKVDVAVIEVGMGGRLDSTNVINPLLSIITNIGFDHTQFLGDTLEKIATEKAGIIKPNVPVIIGQTQSETSDVFMKKAQSMGSSILFADQHYKIAVKDDVSSPAFLPHNCLELHADVYRDNELYINNLFSPMNGSYQLKNLATVCAAFDNLRNSHFPQLTIDHFKDGVANVIKDTGLHGRWERVGENPLTIVETAHNADGIATLVEKLQQLKYNNLHIIYGCVNDKDFSHILNMLPPANYYYTQPSVQRGLDVNILAEKAATLGKPGPSFPTVHSALSHVRSIANPNDLVIITGSIFLVADYFSNWNARVPAGIK